MIVHFFEKNLGNCFDYQYAIHRAIKIKLCSSTPNPAVRVKGVAMI
jgi:hypothetical protein